MDSDTLFSFSAHSPRRLFCWATSLFLYRGTESRMGGGKEGGREGREGGREGGEGGREGGRVVRVITYCLHPILCSGLFSQEKPISPKT